LQQLDLLVLRIEQLFLKHQLEQAAPQDLDQLERAAAQDQDQLERALQQMSQLLDKLE
jgi:hypothetical protein